MRTDLGRDYPSKAVMEDLIIKIGLILAGSGLAGLGYLIKRRIEKKSVFDVIEKHQKLLSLNKELREQKISLHDLCRLEKDILDNRNAIRQYEIDIKKEVNETVKKEEKEINTQFEANQYSYRLFVEAKDKMNNILKEIEKLLDETERKTLKKSQRSWEEFSVEQAQFASMQYNGGSVQPLIYNSELERLTIERAAYLQTELERFFALRKTH